MSLDEVSHMAKPNIDGQRDILLPPGIGTVKSHNADIYSCCARRSVKPLCQTKSDIKLYKIFNNIHFRAMEIEQRQIIVEKYWLKRKTEEFWVRTMRIGSRLQPFVVVVVLSELLPNPPQPRQVGEAIVLWGERWSQMPAVVLPEWADSTWGWR